MDRNLAQYLTSWYSDLIFAEPIQAIHYEDEWDLAHNFRLWLQEQTNETTNS
jgi:hypothetical protein